MNSKKGIMLKFLMALILALIIFLPACIKMSKVFSLSTQAKNNYVDFVDSIVKLHQNPENKPPEEIALLILDKNTAIVYYEPDAKYVIARSDFDHGTTRLDFADDEFHALFDRPGSCEKNKACLCIIRDYKMLDEDNEVERLTNDGDNARITPEKELCDSTVGKLKISPLNQDSKKDEKKNKCGIGRRDDDDLYGYTCTGGFIIDRGIMKAVAEEVIEQENNVFYYKLERRTEIQLVKNGDTITLKG